MRYIEKPIDSQAPRSFRRWLAQHPDSTYSHMHNARAKSDLKQSLVARQKYLCCYCQTRIFEETSHIEHIEPQMGGLSDKTLLYSNMAASCIKDPKSAEGQNQFVRESMIHCGHARGSNIVVSPYDPKCEKLFDYSFSGEIRPNPALTAAADIELAVDSIGYLRLNVPSLMVGRKIAISQTIRLLERGVSPDSILDELDEKLIPFWSAAKFAIARYMQSRRKKD